MAIPASGLRARFRTDSPHDGRPSQTAAGLVARCEVAPLHAPSRGDDLSLCPDAGEQDRTPADGEHLPRVRRSLFAGWQTDCVYSSTKDDNQEIYISKSDGSEKKRLTSDPAIDAHPAWSPDGKKIAFSTSRWGDLELAVMNADGSELVRVTKSPGMDDYPCWSPDGKRLAFTSNRDGNLEIYTIDPDGQNPRNETQNPAIDNFPSWTKDGRLTFVSSREDGFDVYVAPAR
ncbi:MAG: hypothetical protein K8R36_08720 [Planctomycetales bacterium]|nr:hypothetical protein [Planctomycetales bacterium]